MIYVYLSMNKHITKEKPARNVNDMYGSRLPSHTRETRARSLAGKSTAAEIAQFRKRPP